MSAMLRVMVVGLFFLVSCSAARAQKDQDRFGLAKQPQVYLVHQTAKSNFLVQSTGYRVAGGPIATVLQAQESFQLEKKLDLRDPVNYLTDRLSEALRRELGLTNLQLITAASDLPILPENPENMSEEERAANKPGKPTFKQQHPDGVVIEVVTRHWGIDNYKMKYYASLWVTDLGQSKRLLGTSCPWIIFEQVEAKPGGSGFNSQGVYMRQDGAPDAPAIELALYGNNGALLKANLRKAAEQCADKLVGRFLGSGR